MNCTICPNNCNVDRNKRTGMCGADNNIRVSYHGLHLWEEPVISTHLGSGAIFFSGCTMRCVYCQNAKISRSVQGSVYSPSQLAALISHYDECADNINLVSPTPYIQGIEEALEIYQPKNPVIYNTSGYENVSSLSLLEGKIDVFLPDLKYVDSNLSKALSGKSDYFKYAFDAISKMIELVGAPLIENGKILKGVIVRHLIIPSHIDNTLAVLKVFAQYFKGHALLSLMSQYTPVGVENHTEINRRITPLEYKRALNALDKLGITDGFVQELSSASESYIPDF